MSFPWTENRTAAFAAAAGLALYSAIAERGAPARYPCIRSVTCPIFRRR